MRTRLLASLIVCGVCVCLGLLWSRYHFLFDSTVDFGPGNFAKDAELAPFLPVLGEFREGEHNLDLAIVNASFQFPGEVSALEEVAVKNGWTVHVRTPERLEISKSDRSTTHTVNFAIKDGGTVRLGYRSLRNPIERF